MRNKINVFLSSGFMKIVILFYYIYLIIWIWEVFLEGLSFRVGIFSFKFFSF